MEKLWSKDYVLNIVGNLLLFVVFYLLMVYTTKRAINAPTMKIPEANPASLTETLNSVIANLVV